jgi:hypothetical protein
MRTASVFATGFMFCECLRWHDGRLWVSDDYLKQVLTVGAEGKVEPFLVVPNQLAEIGWLPDGPEMTTLFLTTNASGEPRRGQIEIVEVDVPGVGSP